jgi:hypothetical protein
MEAREASITIGAPVSNGKILMGWLNIREDDWKCKPWVRV